MDFVLMDEHDVFHRDGRDCGVLLRWGNTLLLARVGATVHTMRMVCDAPR